MKRTALDDRITDLLRLQTQDVPGDVHLHIEHVLASLPKRSSKPQRKTRMTALTVACALLLFVGASMVVTSNNSFAESIKQKLQSIFGVSGDPALQSDHDSSEMGMLTEITDQNYTLKIHEVMYDGLRLSFSYSLAHVDGISRAVWVLPSFQLDSSLKTDYPGIVMTDSGGTQGDQKTGIVNYYFTGLSPQDFTLRIDVDQITISDESGKEQTIKGNWSFQVPVKRDGAIKTNLLASPLKAVNNETQFEVKQIRTAKRSTLWSFRWEFPEKLRPNPLNDGEPRYDIKYKIVADGSDISNIAYENNGQGRLKHNGQLVAGRRYASTVQVTEQLPANLKELVITPILRTWTKSASTEKWSFTEKLLEDFTIKVNVNDINNGD